MPERRISDPARRPERPSPRDKLEAIIYRDSLKLLELD